MDQPAWDDPSLTAGTMVRSALWLLQVVGEGNTFTKNELRQAFPNVSQIDRRIRDLRSYGWVLYSNTEDASLQVEDQRFVSCGVPVWDQTARREASSRRPISNKERHAVLSRDGYLCTLCGISGGEAYPDDSLATAVLAVSRQSHFNSDGTEVEAFYTECKRCRAGRVDPYNDLTHALGAVSQLELNEARRLEHWINRGRRGSTRLDRAWAEYLHLSPENQGIVADRVAWRALPVGQDGFLSS